MVGEDQGMLLEGRGREREESRSHRYPGFDDCTASSGRAASVLRPPSAAAAPAAVKSASDRLLALWAATIPPLSAGTDRRSSQEVEEHEVLIEVEALSHKQGGLNARAGRVLRHGVHLLSSTAVDGGVHSHRATGDRLPNASLR